MIREREVVEGKVRGEVMVMSLDALREREVMEGEVRGEVMVMSLDALREREVMEGKVRGEVTYIDPSAAMRVRSAAVNAVVKAISPVSWVREIAPTVPEIVGRLFISVGWAR